MLSAKVLEVVIRYGDEGSTPDNAPDPAEKKEKRSHKLQKSDPGVGADNLLFCHCLKSDCTATKNCKAADERSKAWQNNV